ncbi:MAG: hypothetical protein IJ733_18670 [Lachnospiraceae bacterium]|nr:hypothetical protein [Lachnospiraceae bacterium]
MSNQIVNEILLSKLYQTHAYQILADFISEKNSPADTGFLEERFRSYQKHELLFRFEYADGTENKILGGSSAGLLLMPLRGMISVILFLSCMAGALMEYADRRTGLSYVIGTEKNLLCLCSSIFVPAFFAGIIGVLSIHVTEIAEPLQTESISMLCFLFACTSLVYFLSCAIKTR